MSTLIGATFNAPLMAILKRWPHTLHAVDMEHVVNGWERGTFQSICGLRGLRVVGTEVEGVSIAVPWPPALKSLPPGTERCRDCWVESGRMRPRVRWRKVAA